VKGKITKGTSLNAYAALLINAALCALVATVLLFMSRILGRRRGSTVKYEIFETGNPPIGSLRGTRFPVKFYLTAILFIIFDIDKAARSLCSAPTRQAWASPISSVRPGHVWRFYE
jgi:NADH:ubiquinone oxidoreductase subunit 3 (subunit A)